jgi:hypothetical protein
VTPEADIYTASLVRQKSNNHTAWSAAPWEVRA